MSFSLLLGLSWLVPKVQDPPLSLLFSYLNERVSSETFCVLPSLIMILLAMLLFRQLWPSVVLSYPSDRPPEF